MKARDNLLGRISHRPEGEYYCIFCYIKDGVLSFDSNRRNWCRYAAGIGHTCFISVEDKDRQLIEQRRFDLETGQDTTFLKFSKETIGKASREILSEFQKWKQHPDVVAHHEGDSIMYYKDGQKGSTDIESDR